MVAARTVSDAHVLDAVREVAWTTDRHGRRRLTPEGLYGRRKTTAYLRRTRVPDASAGSVDRAMSTLGLVGVRRDKGTRTTIPAKDGIRAADLLDRDFTAAAPNLVWVTDFTYVRTWAGFTYVAFILDVYAQRIVAWHAATSKHTDLVMIPLRMALWQRDREGRPTVAGELIHHSDAGSQYYESEADRASRLGGSGRPGLVTRRGVHPGPGVARVVPDEPEPADRRGGPRAAGRGDAQGDAVRVGVAHAMGAVDKLVTCVMESGQHATHDFALRAVASGVDVVVHVTKQTHPAAEGSAQVSWFVSEIIAVALGEELTGYAVTHVFKAPRTASGRSEKKGARKSIVRTVIAACARLDTWDLAPAASLIGLLDRLPLSKMPWTSPEDMFETPWASCSWSMSIW